MAMLQIVALTERSVNRSSGCLDVVGVGLYVPGCTWFRAYYNAPPTCEKMFIILYKSCIIRVVKTFEQKSGGVLCIQMDYLDGGFGDLQY